MKKRFSWILSFLKIGAIGFGGGTSLIPVIEHEMVNAEKLVTKEEYDSAVIAASITPGALPVEISAYIGKNIGGKSGMFLAAACMVLPGAFLTVLLLATMNSLDSEVVHQIEILSIGVTAFILSMMTRYIGGTFAWAKTENRLWVAVGAVAVVFFLNSGKALAKVLNFFGIDWKPVIHVPTVQILLISIAFLLIYGVLTDRNKAGRIQWQSPVGMLSESAIWLIILILACIPAYFLVPELVKYIGNGFLSSLISFGGGDAYLTVADGMFVQKGIIGQEEFYGRLVLLVNVLPGSILCKTLTGIGYYVGYGSGGMAAALLTAFAGFVCSLIGSCFTITLIRYLFGVFEKMRAFVMLKRWIKAIISGLLGTVILSLIYHCLTVADGYGCSGIMAIAELVVIYLLNIFLVKKFSLGTWVNVVISIGAALAIGNVIM